MVVGTVGWIGLVIASTSVGVHAERVRGLSEDEAGDVLDAIAQELQSGGRTVVIDRRPPSLIDAETSAELSARLGTDELLVYSIFAGPNTVRITGERIGAQGQSLGRTDKDRSVGQEAESAREVVHELFPPLTAMSEDLAYSPAASRTPAVPWIFVGAGNAVLAAGLGLVIHSSIVRADISNTPDYSQGGAERLAAAEQQSAIGAGLLVGGVACVTAGIVWLLLER